MMFDYMGWKEVGRLITRGVENAIKSKRVTYDLARQMTGPARWWQRSIGARIISSPAAGGGTEPRGIAVSTF